MMPIAWYDVPITGIDDAISILRPARQFMLDSASTLARYLGRHTKTVLSWERGRYKRRPALTSQQERFIIDYVIEAQSKAREFYRKRAELYYASHAG